MYTVYVHIYTHVHTCVHTHVYMYVFIHIYICILYIYTHHIPGSWNTSNFRYWCRRNTQPPIGDAFPSLRCAPQRSPGWILDGRAQNAARRSRTTWSLLEPKWEALRDGPMKKADGKWWAMARMVIVERWWWWWWTIDEQLMNNWWRIEQLMGDSEWSCVETGFWCNCNGDKAYPDPWAWHILELLDICINRRWGYPKGGKSSLGL